MEKKWYAIRTFPGYEYKVQEKLIKKVEKENLNKVITQTYIPTYKNYVFIRKNLKLREELIYPGYIFIEMTMTNETMYFVRGIQYVIGYAGKSENKKFPDPVFEKEVEQMRLESKRVNIVIEIGNNVKINDGFNVVNGKVKKINVEKEELDVNIEGTIGTYKFTQVEKA